MLRSESNIHYNVQTINRLISGADITVVLEEFVKPDQFTEGSCEINSFKKVKVTGKRRSVVVNIARREFQRQTVTQAGDNLSWTVCLSLSFFKVEMEFISRQMGEKLALQKEDLCYLPPSMDDGILKSGIMVKDGTLITVNADTDSVMLGTDSHCEERLVEPSHACGSTEAEESESRESDVLVNDAERPSLLVDEGGDQVSGSAEGEGEQCVLIEGITSGN